MFGAKPRHGRPRPPSSLRYAVEVRPLDPLTSIRMKLGVLVAASVSVSSILVWTGRSYDARWYMTFPLAIMLSLVVTQILARGMTSPLREMTRAARAMSAGDYSIRVRTTSRDEVGQLGHAFNAMAADLASLAQAQRAIVANVSHELRTPIAALRAQLENMVDGVVEPDEEALGSALVQTERLTNLVTYLLDLSRLEAGAAGLHLQEVRVVDVIEEVVDAASHASRAGGREVRWEVDVPGSLQFVVDVERVHQILLNLLANASRHSPQHGTVLVRARSTDREVEIDVIDQGPGIPAESRERIFERFERGTAPTLPAGSGGTGLGLAIARWATGLHGGTLRAVAPPAGTTGAVLRLRLPIEGPTPGGRAAAAAR
ncbi:HAMP domain-containing sensor histidine kinase [Serinibacter salmoneus]|uniref:Signal transduction histidine-protein kinase/phosphatase MprB n=1 Tax=Serinibacter salmoneus TaxID=556530 RepID=A0A2A9D1Q2_9MICO|nr:ATP-binding protein [Serinibacter salmoneus]PFG20311.1 signal transduction histidine kinase [Serinibacter salmoneus]